MLLNIGKLANTPQKIEGTSRDEVLTEQGPDFRPDDRDEADQKGQETAVWANVEDRW